MDNDNINAPVASANVVAAGFRKKYLLKSAPKNLLLIC